MKALRLCKQHLLYAALGCVVGSTSMGNAIGATGAVIICPHLPGDLVEIPECNGRQATCVGTTGHDLVWGTDGDDVIYTDAGNDVVQADAGNDVVCGGPGNDALHGSRGNDELHGDDGDDWLFGARGDDRLLGGAGDFDVLWGGPGFDQLDGGPGEKDTCLLQRDMGSANSDTCEAVHPPPGYEHDDEFELGPGIIGER